jgi:hypothetical protein
MIYNYSLEFWHYIIYDINYHFRGENMPGKLSNTKEVAIYLGIHEKQIYLLIKTGKITCRKNQKLQF